VREHFDVREGEVVFDGGEHGGGSEGEDGIWSGEFEGVEPWPNVVGFGGRKRKVDKEGNWKELAEFSNDEDNGGFDVADGSGEVGDE
jgi:hypothetical protein